MRLSKNLKEQLLNNPEAIKAYINYANYGKVHPGKFAIFQDFASYEIDTLFANNQILSLVDSSQNDFVCYPNLVKIFYANLNREFYEGNDNEIWSSVKGTKIVLNCDLLGTILNCKNTGMDLSSFQIDEHDRETFHHIFERDENFEFKNQNFHPKARIVNLLLQHTLTPKIGKF